MTLSGSSAPASARELTYLVAGMSCGHCKVAVTDEVSRVAGVDAVDVDLDSKLVRVRGTGVDEAAVVAAIDEVHLRRGAGMTAANRHFARHYVEMVVAMLLGMVVLGTPATLALGAAGMSMSELHNDFPALMLFAMAVAMTVPMVAWMRYRGHGWAASAEMAASMLKAAAQSSP